MAEERRKEEGGQGTRYLLVPKLTGAGDPFGRVSIVNLSARGARLEHSVPVQRDSTVRVEADLPNAADPLSFRGRVIWTRLAWRGRGSQDSCWITGVEFPDDEKYARAVGFLCSIGRAVPFESLRRCVRYQLTPPIGTTSKNGGDCRILDASKHGFRINSTRALRPGSDETLTFQPAVGTAPQRVSVIGRVIWSKALPADDSAYGRMSYAAGIGVKSSSEPIEPLIERLCDEGFARLDLDAAHRRIEKIRRRTIEREQARSQVKGTEVSDADLLLIRHIRERLLAHPDEALPFYNRAKFAAADPQLARMLDPDTPYRTEILAVWECLERTISLPTITAAFRRM